MRSVRELLKSNFCIDSLCSVKVPACFSVCLVSRLCGRGRGLRSSGQERKSSGVSVLVVFRGRATARSRLVATRSGCDRTGLARQAISLTRKVGV